MEVEVKKRDINDDTLQNTTKCGKGFACLSSGDGCLAEVESAVGGTLLFVECTDGSCRYRIHFGHSYVCTCPTRVEIYAKYRI